MNMVLQQSMGLHETARLDRKASVTQRKISFTDDHHPLAGHDRHAAKEDFDQNDAVTVNGHQYIKAG